MTRASSSSLLFRTARSEDAPTIAALVNSAYRGDSSRAGWTTEADLLVGLRTTPREVAEMIGGDASAMLLCLLNDEIVGTVYLERQSAACYLGMFVVKPVLQGGGIGRQFLAEAEAFARREWAATKMEMTVITLRHELIAYYERRGYRRTGVFKPFPVEESASVPQVENLEFEVLAKSLQP